MEGKNIKLGEKKFRMCLWRRKGDNSNSFLLEKIEGFKVEGICRCPDEVTIAAQGRKRK